MECKYTIGKHFSSLVVFTIARLLIEIQRRNRHNLKTEIFLFHDVLGFRGEK